MFKNKKLLTFAPRIKRPIFRAKSLNLKIKKMKKGLLLVVVMLATIAVKAQDIYVGGSLNVWRNSTGNTTSFKVAPEIGYNFNETWAIGAELNYSNSHNQLSNDQLTTYRVTKNSVSVAPYIRWSYYQNDAVRLFLDGTAAIGFNKVKDGDTSKAGQVGLRPGIAVKLNDNFSFIAKYGFLGYRRNVSTAGDSFGLALTSEDLSIGFHYTF